MFMFCRPKQDVSPKVQRYLDFGNKNEINAIATLVSVLMPALLPECSTFYEVGLKFISGITCNNIHLIEVSADGLITCNNGTKVS